MSTNFAPLEIPPGVVAKATNKMRSSNWSLANAVRWVEGRLAPIGGQEIIAYAIPFASRCRAIHSWYDLHGNYLIAYLCETNVYVDSGGTLTEITPSLGLAAPSTPAQGYGMGDYGSSIPAGFNSYGVPPRPNASAAAILNVLPDMWSIDNFGALLLVMTSPDGRLLQWDPAGTATPNLMTQVPNSPNGRCFVVTSDRFVQVFGMVNNDIPAGTGIGGLARFGWCDQGNVQDWNFTSVTNQAGFIDLEPASPIVTAHAGRSGWTLFFTSKKAYLSQYLGLPFVYNAQELADDCTPYSPASITSTSSLMAWMSQQGAFTFDGSSITPVDCQIRPWIDGLIDYFNARWQAVAVHIGQFNEFWWFFPQAGSKTNTHAAIFNYREGWWSTAQMPRSAGITSSYAAEPIFADGVKIYRHESGVFFNDCAMPYATTFDLNLNSGGKLTTFKQMMVNLEGPGGGPSGMESAITYSLHYKNNRLGSAPETSSGQKPVRADGYVDFRATGRDMRLHIQVNGPQVQPFTLGQHLVDVVPRGDR